MSKNVWQDIGKSHAEQLVCKLKAQYWNELLDRVEASGFTQTQLAEIWGTKQPNVSKVLRGKLSDVSIDLLISYLCQLGLKDIRSECYYGT